MYVGYCTTDFTKETHKKKLYLQIMQIGANGIIFISLAIYIPEDLLKNLESRYV